MVAEILEILALLAVSVLGAGLIVVGCAGMAMFYWIVKKLMEAPNAGS